MFSESPELYDLIYSFKDYRAESVLIRELIRREHPHARSILDVGCGTAEHARFLVDQFEIHGIDLQPEFVELARRKCPSGRFEVADMRCFDLPRRFDVVQCLFSAIGYLTEPADVIAALKCFARHLNPGGMIVVEPWFTPDAYRAGVPHLAPPVDLPELKIVRVNVSELSGRLSVLRFHYLVGRPDGVRHFEELHTLALYTVDEMLSFFAEAQLKASYDPRGIFGRGLYLARLG